jgi:hypothetical protein
MTTALDYHYQQPATSVLEKYSAGKIPASSSTLSSGIMSSHHHQRRPSALSSVANSSSSAAPLSTLEDSGNVNNRGLFQNSGSQRNLQRAQSSSSLKATQQQQNNNPRTSSRSRSPQELSYEDGCAVEVEIEEKRKRANGAEGYTLHRYTLGRLLGKGGFAKVYLCTAHDTGKKYAAKVVPKANLVKARARQKVCVDMT